VAGINSDMIALGKGRGIYGTTAIQERIKSGSASSEVARGRHGPKGRLGEVGGSDLRKQGGGYDAHKSSRKIG